MGLRGPKPMGATYHKMVGNYRPSVHGPLPERTAAMVPSEISEDEQAERKREIDQMRARLYGESGPPDPGPRSGGSAKRIRW